MQTRLERIADMDLVPYKRTKPVLDVIASLKKSGLICEIKRASPSEGMIKEGVDPVKQGKKYQKYGAGAISVLTEPDFFKGSYADLKAVSDSVSIPVLCKDFILHPIQIENAYRSGADLILLIADILTIEQLERLTEVANRYGLTILYEIHDPKMFEKFAHLKPKLVGVNSRNLKTFKISLKSGAETISKLTGDFLKIAESGLNDGDDIAMMQHAGADGFLIGTALMRSKALQKTFKLLQKKGNTPQPPLSQRGGDKRSNNVD